MSFEMNKILGALLGAMILAMATGFIAKALVNPEELAKPAYMVAGVKEANAPAAAAPAGPEPIGPLLASASAANGKDIVNRLCVACHTFNKGDPNRIGPNLYDVFDQPIAEGHGGYPFSSALVAHDKDKWTPDLLNAWLSGPQDFAHGTKMTFVGLPKAKDRADVIAYLDSLSDSPEALTKFETAPKPPAAVKPAAAPAAAPAPAAKPAATAPTATPATAPAAAPAAPAPAAKPAAAPAATPAVAPAAAPAATAPTPTPAATPAVAPAAAPAATAPTPAPAATAPANPAPAK
jgi:cytochrome c